MARTNIKYMRDIFMFTSVPVYLLNIHHTNERTSYAATNTITMLIIIISIIIICNLKSFLVLSILHELYIIYALLDTRMRRYRS